MQGEDSASNEGNGVGNMKELCVNRVIHRVGDSFHFLPNVDTRVA